MKVSRRRFVTETVFGAAFVASGCTQLMRVEADATSDTQPFWLVRRGASKVYIFVDFGSVTPKWSAPRVEAAFSEAQVFWKETADLAADTRDKFIAAGRAGDRPLSTWLTAEQKEDVAAAAVEAGTTYAALEPLKPWLAAISLNAAYNQSRKHVPVDEALPILNARALAQGKTIRAEFPDAESQLELTNSLSPAAQVEYLFFTIENNRTSPDAVDRRRRVWIAGDLSLETRQVEHFKANFPNLYEPFEVRRNLAWPARIRQMLDEGQTSFVMVGAWHMVGPDSVPVQLSRGGLTAERI